MSQVCRLSQIFRTAHFVGSRWPRCAWLLLVGVGLQAGIVDRARGLEADSQEAATVKLKTYAKPDGQIYFALKLSPQLAQPKAQPTDVVILFDTSASQVGPYRAKGLDTLRAMLGQLAAHDRVALVAVDVTAARLTPSWVPPQGEEIRKAMSALERRVPLGSTDMREALETALDTWQQSREAQRTRSVVYLGDGFSTANAVPIETLQQLARQFVERRVSISSYAIGPRLNGELLGPLANHTGGMFVVDEDRATGRQLGSYLATIAEDAVVWPTDGRLPDGMKNVYPRATPPLRFDRDSVLVGTFALDAVATQQRLPIEIKGELAGKPLTFTWQAVPEPPVAENAYLASVVELAAQTDGVALPTGGAGLNELRRWVGQAAPRPRRAAEAPSAVIDEPARLAGGALETTPAPVAPAPGNDFRLARAGAAADDRVADGDLVTSVERQQSIIEGFLWSEVTEAVNRANASSDPAAAGYQLKLVLDKVQHTGEIKPESRAQLVEKIEGALRMASRNAAVKTELDLRQQQVNAAVEARERMSRELTVQQDKVDQLMSRFDALMAEERYRDAEALAYVAEEMAPAMRGAELTARMTGYQANINQMRDSTYKGLVDMLYQVELSNVPTPDDPPIIYPDPEVWQLTTERRKKYKAVDLKAHGPNEERILASLDEKTEIDFAEQPLGDVIDYLKNRHGIEIQLDKKALSDAGIGSDVPITRSFKGITLRSALKLLLGELDMTYVLRNEVLMITSKTEAENMLSQRVYPVADLVTPISAAKNLAGPMGGGMGGGILGAPMGMGGGGYGMGMGGMGMGGMGGMGMGGMGGMGMGGMGGMGGGMGFF